MNSTRALPINIDLDDCHILHVEHRRSEYHFAEIVTVVVQTPKGKVYYAALVDDLELLKKPGEAQDRFINGCTDKVRRHMGIVDG